MEGPGRDFHQLGCLDVHTHFTLPMSDEEAQQLVETYQGVDFMVKTAGQVRWTPEKAMEGGHPNPVQMQMLSYVPPDHDKLRAANDHAHKVVCEHSTRFGQLAALPTDDGDACVAEIHRVLAYNEHKPDGFATLTQYNGVLLSDPRLEPVWKILDERHDVVHIHPDAYLPGEYGRPAPLINVAFDTAKVVTDMLYKGIFRRYPNIRFILGHCGGALPALSGRLRLLGTLNWIRNEQGITRDEIEDQLSRLYVDTAATAKTGLIPAITMVGAEKCIYGSDYGVPCSTKLTILENFLDIEEHERNLELQSGTILNNGWKLFPAATQRVREIFSMPIG